MRIAASLILILFLLLVVACDDDVIPNPGFGVQTVQQDFVNGIPTAPARKDPGVAFKADYAFGNFTSGTLDSCEGPTNLNAFFACPNRKAPGIYGVLALSGECVGDVSSMTVSGPGTMAGVICIVILRTFNLTVSPTSADLGSSPQTFEVTGSGLDDTYGMPILAIVDPVTGNTLGQATATAIDENGTWIQVPANFGYLFTGDYAGIVFNKTSGQYLEAVGGFSLYLYGHDPTEADFCVLGGGWWINESCVFSANPGCQPGDWGFDHPEYECSHYYSDCRCLIYY